MSRYLFALLAMVSAALSASAQSGARLEPGDPPVLSLISVSAADENGLVTITGLPGAVFPNARLAIRNLYTEQTVYVTSGVTGNFEAQIIGPGNTPFWISPVNGRIPPEQQNVPGALPGGPGTIIRGAFPTITPSVTDTTQLVIDGDLNDWTGYPDAALSPDVYALRNRSSLYFGIANLPGSYAQIQFLFTVDGAPLEVTLDPRAGQSGSVRRDEPNSPVEPLSMAVATQDTNVELRFLVDDLRDDATTITLNAVNLLDANNNPVADNTLDATLNAREEGDGIARIGSTIPAEATRFSIGGAVAGGAGYWLAQGQIDRLTAQAGDTLSIQLDVTLSIPDLTDAPITPRMEATLGLQPILARQTGGTEVIAGLLSNNGWSNVLTPSGLAIDNLTAEAIIGTAATPSQRIIRRGDTLSFPLDFTATLPADLPDGLYIPFMRGAGSLGGIAIPWEANGAFDITTDTPTTSRLTLTRLPTVLNVGGVEGGRLVWALFFDSPSDGSRGILAEEDQQTYALSNRVRFNSPTYILPPFDTDGEPLTYPLEPYLLNQVTNAADSSAAPLVPLLLPGGRLDAEIRRPDGTTDPLGSGAITQNQLSTSAEQDSALFGTYAPVDAYRLTTLTPAFGEYTFTQYGEHVIRLTGTVEDVWGNRYEGGGSYRVLIAEQLDLTPGVLPGTPFEVGNTLAPTLTVAPAVPADVTLTLRVYPLDGSAMRETVITGSANRYGYFYSADAPIVFDTPGEYTLDYEARYTDGAGRLWAGSLRGAGVIANPQPALVAHGERGLSDSSPNAPRLAWYDLRRYAGLLAIDADEARPYQPYHRGDVVWLADGSSGGFAPLLTGQDLDGRYEAWLASADPALAARITADALPLTLIDPAHTYGAALSPEPVANQAYAYQSVVRPGVSVRQYVQGGESGGLTLLHSSDDPYNEQIGAGAAGDQPGDILFLFGGAVVRNAEAGFSDTAIYGALGVVIDEDDERGVRVYPPYRGEAGGAQGGALFSIDDTPVDLFYLSSGVQPGQVFERGDVLALSGHAAPTLPSRVLTRVTAPDGTLYSFDTVANAVGYAYDPAANLTLDQLGVWTVEITVQHEGLTSVGQMIPPFPQGGVLGAAARRFNVYVVAPEAEALVNNYRADFPFPSALPFNFNIPIPADWSDVRAYRTLVMPGYVLEDGALQVVGSTLGYQYNPTFIARAFPNFENNPGVDGASGADPLTLVFVITGSDTEGRFQVRARVFNFRHDRLMSLEATE